MIHVRILIYLLKDIVLYVCHLINKMSSSILYDKSHFSCLFPDKALFLILSRAFGCTYFVQDLAPKLDKLSLCSIKCVFTTYLHTQKGLGAIILHLKILYFCIVPFFESVSFFYPYLPASYLLPICLC